MNMLLLLKLQRLCFGAIAVAVGDVAKAVAAAAVVVEQRQQQQQYQQQQQHYQ